MAAAAPLSMGPQTAAVDPYANTPFSTTNVTATSAGPAAYPGFVAPYDPSTMSDVSNLQQLGPGYSQGFNALRNQALNQGPSAWLNMSQMKNQMQLEDALNRSKQSGASGVAGQDDALAAGGGLSSGARERVQEQGGVNAMDMSQGLQRTGMENNLGLETQDQSNKLTQLNNLVSDENTKQNQWNDAFKTDVSAGEQNVQQQNAYNMNAYQTQMQAWGAAQQANATANSGKK